MFVKIVIKLEETRMALAQRMELPVSYAAETYNNAVTAVENAQRKMMATTSRPVSLRI